MKSLECLKGVEIRNNCPLNGFSFFRSGGVARTFCIVHRKEDLIPAREILLSRYGDLRVLGAGSNVLMPDGDMEVPVLKLGREFVYVRPCGEETVIAAGAATSLAAVLNYCITRGLGGLEYFCGIPATIGGMAVMNASCFGCSVLSQVRQVEVIGRQGEKKVLPAAEIVPGYRTSSLKGYIVTEVVFALKKDAMVREKAGDFLKKRLQGQDYSLPSLGCVFKNPASESAGRLIDQCGLKGTCVGDACVSAKHANFIVNKGKARGSDVEELIGIIRRKVSERWALDLEEEIIRW